MLFIGFSIAQSEAVQTGLKSRPIPHPTINIEIPSSLAFLAFNA